MDYLEVDHAVYEDPDSLLVSSLVPFSKFCSQKDVKFLRKNIKPIKT
jgi:hypothetical protein